MAEGLFGVGVGYDNVRRDDADLGEAALTGLPVNELNIRVRNGSFLLLF